MPPRPVAAPTMKLRWVKAYTTSSGKDYGRYDVTLPREIVDALGWKKDMELEAVQTKDGVTLRPAKK